MLPFKFNFFSHNAPKKNCSFSCPFVSQSSTLIALPRGKISKSKNRACILLNGGKQALRYYASGSSLMTIFSFTTLITVSFLHQGQNSGKLMSTVSSNTFARVLLLQCGHLIQRDSLSMKRISTSFTYFRVSLLFSTTN